MMPSDLLRAFLIYIYIYIYYLKENKVELSSSTLPNRQWGKQTLQSSADQTGDVRDAVGMVSGPGDEVRTWNKKIGSLDIMMVKVNVSGRVLYLFNAPAD